MRRNRATSRAGALTAGSVAGRGGPGRNRSAVTGVIRGHDHRSTGRFAGTAARNMVRSCRRSGRSAGAEVRRRARDIATAAQGRRERGGWRAVLGVGLGFGAGLGAGVLVGAVTRKHPAEPAERAGSAEQAPDGLPGTAPQDGAGEDARRRVRQTRR